MTEKTPWVLNPENPTDRAEIIALRNDQFRSQLLDPTKNPQVLLTRGVADLGIGSGLKIIKAVCDCDEFDEGDDPHGERDFGAFKVNGHALFWKIDYYDLNMEGGSQDPADPSITTRVLTIMLASEY